VVGVLFVVAPRIVGDDGIHFKEAEEEDETLTEFAAGDVIHHVVVVVEVVDFFAAKDFGHGVGIALVGGDGFGIPARARHIIVGHADHIGGVAFIDQLERGAGGEDGDVVGVGLDEGEDFALVRFAGDGAFNDKGAVFVEGLNGALLELLRDEGRGYS
jgi:hypothetical protein